MKRGGIKTLRNKADRVMQEFYRERKPRCEMCGAQSSCQHHIISKAASSALRYKEENLVSVCTGCHLKFHSKFAPEMVARLTLMRGQEWYDKLQVAKQEYVKPSQKYYKLIIEKYG